MTISRIVLFAGVIGGLAAVAGCQSASGPAATSIDGKWASADGAASASFSGGSFTTAANGKTIEQGSYVVSGASVSMIGTSVVTKQAVNYSCSLASPKQLNCSNSTGQSFALIRRG